LPSLLPPPLSLHDALPILTVAVFHASHTFSHCSSRPTNPNTSSCSTRGGSGRSIGTEAPAGSGSHSTSHADMGPGSPLPSIGPRSEEHTSELQSRENLVCR